MCIYSDVYTLCDWKPRIKIQPLVLSSVVDQGSRRHMGLISQRGQPVHHVVQILVMEHSATIGQCFFKKLESGLLLLLDFNMRSF